MHAQWHLYKGGRLLWEQWRVSQIKAAFLLCFLFVCLFFGHKIICGANCLCSLLCHRLRVHSHIDTACSRAAERQSQSHIVHCYLFFFYASPCPPERQFSLQSCNECIWPEYKNGRKKKKNSNAICTKDKWIVWSLWDWPSFWGCRWINKTWLGIDAVPQAWLKSQRRTKLPFDTFRLFVKDGGVFTNQPKHSVKFESSTKTATSKNSCCLYSIYMKLYFTFDSRIHTVV